MLPFFLIYSSLPFHSTFASFCSMRTVWNIKFTCEWISSSSLASFKEEINCYAYCPKTPCYHQLHAGHGAPGSSCSIYTSCHRCHRSNGSCLQINTERERRAPFIYVTNTVRQSMDIPDNDEQWGQSMQTNSELRRNNVETKFKGPWKSIGLRILFLFMTFYVYSEPHQLLITYLNLYYCKNIQ